MPNYKVFQDYADSMRVKIYGIDDANNTTPLLTNASGKLDVVGAVEFSGQVSGTVTVSGQVSGTVDIGSGTVKVSSGVEVSGGTIEVSGQVSGTVTVSGQVSGTVDIGSGTVKVSSGVEVSGGTIEVSGQVSGTVTVSGEVSGTVDIGSGTVKVSSGVEVSGIANVSGSALYVRGAVVDSGPLSSGISGQDSGVFGGDYWDVLGYGGWTFAVKYSGDSGANVNARLQISATASGSDWVNVDPEAADYSGKTWNFFATTYQVRYARMYYVNDSGASGAMQLHFQAEY